MKRPSKRSSYLVVLMTSPKRTEARRIADALLRERAAACVGIFTRGESFFWWEGKIDRAEEYLLVAKTTESAFPRLVALVKKNHSYQVPEIVALPIVGGNGEYLRWVGEETRIKGED
jgi:periplasmic divalent cation tolerance protein